MPVRTTLSSLLSITLAASTVAFPLPASASRLQPPVAMAAFDDAATILGLDGNDEAAAAALTRSLRRAFAKRGLGGGEEVSLAEVRLTMGCDNDQPECLAQAGRSLNVRKLVYGYLRAGDGGGYKLELVILDVSEQIVEAQTTNPLSAADLQADKIDATAEEIVNGLFPEERDADLPAPVPILDSAPVVQVDETPTREPRQSKYEWGKYSPRPTWKWAGFGTSLTLLLLSGAAVLGTGLALEGPLRKDLLDASDASLLDDKPNNDTQPIPESYNNDTCAYASEDNLPNADPQEVRNAAVTQVCNRAAGVEKAHFAAIAVMAVAGVSTIIFTTLLFVHRREPSAAALRRRGIQLGASPTPDGGFMVGSRFRF
jgi:hypothetical protein